MDRQRWNQLLEKSARCACNTRNLGKGRPLRAPRCIPTGSDTTLGQLARSILARPSRRRPCHQTVSSVNHSSEVENALSPPTPPHARTCCRSITDQESLQAPPIPPWPCHGDDFIETNRPPFGCHPSSAVGLLARRFAPPAPIGSYFRTSCTYCTHKMVVAEWTTLCSAEPVSS
jgi:DNA-directed RNA polymerase subunit RPC12/RpoP